MKYSSFFLKIPYEIGGVFHYGNLEAVPYNHWKQDCKWLVLLIDPPDIGAFISVTALTAREACQAAFLQYNTTLEDDDDV